MTSDQSSNNSLSSISFKRLPMTLASLLIPRLDWSSRHPKTSKDISITVDSLSSLNSLDHWHCHCLSTLSKENCSNLESAILMAIHLFYFLVLLSILAIMILLSCSPSQVRSFQASMNIMILSLFTFNEGLLTVHLILVLPSNHKFFLTHSSSIKVLPTCLSL